jgi:hypothetical protein
MEFYYKRVVYVFHPFVVMTFHGPSVFEVLVAEAGDERDDGLYEGVGREEVTEARVSEKSALALEAEHDWRMCGVEWRWLEFLIKDSLRFSPLSKKSSSHCLCLFVLFLYFVDLQTLFVSIASNFIYLSIHRLTIKAHLI